MKIVFFGTDDNSLVVLKGLLLGGHEIKMVVTSQDYLKARSKKKYASPVNEYCVENKVPSSVGLSSKNLEGVDVIVVDSYGKIISESLFKVVPYGALNIHPSLLPSYRGPSPVRTALLNQDKETGVSIISLNSKMDSGPIIKQEKVVIKDGDSLESLTHKLFSRGLENLLDILSNPQVIKSARAQEEARATYTNKFLKEDGIIDWKQPGKSIISKIKAMGKSPGAHTTVGGKKFIIYQAVLGEKATGLEPGRTGISIFKGTKTPFIQSKDHQVLIMSLKPENKKEITGTDLINGYPELFNKD